MPKKQDDLGSGNLDQSLGTEIPAWRREVGKRIKEIESVIGNRELAAHVAGCGVSTLASWVAGKADPSFESLVKLSRTAGVRLDWVASGEGPKRRGDHHLEGMADAAAGYTAEWQAVANPVALAHITATVIGYCRGMESQPRLEDLARIIVNTYEKALRAGGREGLDPTTFLDLLEELGELTDKQRS